MRRSTSSIRGGRTPSTARSSSAGPITATPGANTGPLPPPPRWFTPPAAAVSSTPWGRGRRQDGQQRNLQTPAVERPARRHRRAGEPRRPPALDGALASPVPRGPARVTGVEGAVDA